MKTGCQIAGRGDSRALSGRRLRVSKPRLRRKGAGAKAEVAVPAYEAMQRDTRLGERVLEILMRGVSTRQYKEVLPEMAETVGVSKSSVGREFAEASEEALRALCERRFDDKDILIVYVDGQVFGGHHVLTAVGVDRAGNKHVLGMVESAGESAVAAKALLEDLVERGLRADRKRPFVIDGSKALRCAIDAVFGADNPVQRCRSPNSPWQKSRLLRRAARPPRNDTKTTCHCERSCAGAQRSEAISTLILTFATGR